MPAKTPQEAEAATRLRASRRLAGMTQEEAAHALGVTGRTYARWERGETVGFLRELDKIAKAFGTTPEALLGGEPEADIEARLAALQSEVAQLRELLLDPATLRRAAEALAEEEGE